MFFKLKLFSKPEPLTVAQSAALQLLQTKHELLEAETKVESWDAHAKMLRQRIARLEARLAAEGTQIGNSGDAMTSFEEQVQRFVNASRLSEYHHPTPIPSRI